MAGVRLGAKQSVIAQREEARTTSLAQAIVITKTDHIHASNHVFSEFQKDLYVCAHAHTLMCTHYTTAQRYCPTVLDSSVTEITNNCEVDLILKCR